LEGLKCSIMRILNRSYLHHQGLKCVTYELEEKIHFVTSDALVAVFLAKTVKAFKRMLNMLLMPLSE
jgi:hypothetical protein